MHPTKFMARGKTQLPPKLSEEERAARLERLSQVIAGKRKEAVDARKESGIEAVWLACEEAYLGIDDANRHEFNDAKWSKPTSITGPVTKDKAAHDDTRSTAFVRLTSRYVDGATSKLAEIILPVDDRAFKLDATPDPDLIAQSKDLTPIVDQLTGQPVPKPPEDPSAETAQIPAAGQPPGAPTVMTRADLAKQKMEQAQDSADKAETRIYDWMVESSYPAEARKVIHDAARIGVGVLKAPFPEYREARVVTKLPANGVAIQNRRKIAPAMRWVDPWNIFPDDGCGEDIHAGEGLFERDFLSTKKLKKLKNDKDYLADRIDAVIEEGPGKVYETGNPNEKKKRNRWEIWYYYGTIKREDFELISADAADDIPQDQDDVHAIVSMVNDTIIRAVINPLDSGAFPYRAMTWSRRAGHWAGVGVGERVAMPQRAVNAATRALFNNAGWSAGVQVVIDQTGIVPADNSWKITPNKIWYKTGESTAAKVEDAFKVFVFPSVQQALSAIIEYGMKLAEESTGIPLVTQGQTGPTTPQTFGQAELQDNNAHTWLRNIGYRYDDMITEPLVRDLYEWLLLDPEVPNDEKGDFQINANGSIAMVERAIQEQTLMSLLGTSVNPAFRVAPHKLFAQIVKTKRLDPRQIQYTDEEWQKISQQPPAPTPQEKVARINAATTLHKQDMADQAELQRIQAESVHEQQQLQSGGTTPHMASATARIEQERIRAATAERVEASRSHAEMARADKEMLIAQQNGEYEIMKMQLQRDLAVLEYSAKHNLTLDQVKVDLAKTAMQEQTRRQLADAEIELARSEGEKDRLVDLHKHHNPAPSLVRDEVATAKTP